MQVQLFDNLTQGLTDVLTLRQRQHALTATNLANSETPGFKAKAIRFQASLDAVLGSQTGRPLDASQADIEEIEPTPWAVDGNSVSPEREQARLKHNALMYRAVSRGLSSRMAMLKYAANDGA